MGNELTTLANTENHPLMKILHNPETIKRFELACGRQAGSVMINIINAANMNPSIWECEPNSVITAALNISALGLSLAPGVGQACILPFNKNKKVGNEWTSEKRAQAVIMLRGVKDMAMRTNKYRVLNAFPVYEGQEWVEDQRSGIGNPEGPILNKKNIIGYGAYLQLYKGFEATVYKTKDEILAHAMQYSPTWDKQKQAFKPGSRWLDHFDEQALKTVMKDLIMNHGEIDTNDRAMLEMVESSDNGPDLAALSDQDSEVVDGKISESPAPALEISPEEEAFIQAQEVETPGHKLVWKLPDEQLIECLKYSEKHPDVAKAATAVIAWRAIQKKREDEAIQQLGF